MPLKLDLIGQPSPTNPDAERLIIDFDDFQDPDNPYRFLSNFYVPEIPYAIPDIDRPNISRTCMTTEHYFAAMKTVVKRNNILAAADPSKAKHMGRVTDLRSDWDAIRYDVMRMALRWKFTPGREEADALVRTGDAALIEGTYWDDRIWGVDMTTEENGRHPGKNWLGILLMARRAELRAGVI